MFRSWRLRPGGLEKDLPRRLVWLVGNDIIHAHGHIYKTNRRNLAAMLAQRQEKERVESYILNRTEKELPAAHSSAPPGHDIACCGITPVAPPSPVPWRSKRRHIAGKNPSLHIHLLLFRTLSRLPSALHYFRAGRGQNRSWS